MIYELIRNGLPLLGLRSARAEVFQSTQRGGVRAMPVRDRQRHASALSLRVTEIERELAETRDQAVPHASGSLVAAIGEGLDDSSVSRQLRDRETGTDVVAVRENRAIVHAPQGLGALSGKIQAYAREETPGGKPRFQNLIARLDDIQPATIEDLSLGEISETIPDKDWLWAEIWMPGGAGVTDDQREYMDEAVHEFAIVAHGSFTDRPGRLFIPIYRGPERDVHLVRASGAVLKALPVLLPSAVEVHPAPLVTPIVLAEAADEAGESPEIEAPGPGDAAVAVHDTGIAADHPYVAPILLGASSVVPGAPSPADEGGHGTQMAGVAAYSRLAEGLTAGHLAADAWMVSVRLLESKEDAGGDPDRGPLWAERTTESIAAAEALAPQRAVVHNISLGAENLAVGRTDRTAWSVAVDVLGWNDGAGRALVTATGNAELITDRDNYPSVNLGPPHLQQPGQAWNVLTVGGYTGLDVLTKQDRENHYPAPLAVAGTLSPHSRTAPGGNRPLKPDLVMEAGNTAPGSGLENPDAQGLSILTLDAHWRDRGTRLRRTWATSPAVAAASNALARIANAHPGLRPATWRGLLVHTTEWPGAAREQFCDKRDLLRSFGYGVPVTDRAFASDSNRPVMVYEGAIRPSHRNAEGRTERRADFIELPLPFDELDQLADARVTLAVTLSFFIEPTDNLTRGTYAGGRLRWDLQGPTEDPDGFRARINRLTREQGHVPGGGSFDWEIGTAARSRGTLQHDRARVAASQLAGPRLLAVYPVTGWWEDSAATHERRLHYSVIVSVDLGEVDLDLYAMTAVALQPVSIEV